MENQAEFDPKSVTSLIEHWSTLSHEDRKESFNQLPRTEAEELFLNLKSEDQFELLSELSPLEKRSWIRLLAPDDVADLIQEFEPDERQTALQLLDGQTRHEVIGLLAYAEDDAGGLMNPRYIRLRPAMTVEEAIRYIRAQARGPIEVIYYAYVLDFQQRLKGVVSFRDLFLAPPTKRVDEIMQRDLVTVHENMDQEEVGRLVSQYEYMALPVVDSDGRMMGLVTMDDIVSVVEEEATEDIQKLGGTQALDAPYMKIGVLEMVRKRGVWLVVLFVGELLTASAIGRFEENIQRAVVLSFFIPLIISSGGNSGSQASTLIIRALALREIQLRDWWRILGRELITGALLGLVLGLIGWLRIVLWPQADVVYGAQYMLVGATVAASLVGVVLWGSVTGSMLPFILRRLKLDPATASAPFVATIVDVTGILIYFSLASWLLSDFLG